MIRRPLLSSVVLLHLALALACRGDKDEPVESSDDTQTQTDDSPAHSDPLTAEDMPASPAPFTLTLTGAWPVTLTFDQPTCSSPVGSSNLRVFWRGSSHVAVLVLNVLGTYQGAGDYTEAEHGLRVALQEEAGGSGYYFASETGDDISATVLFDDDSVAWGEYTVTTLHSDSGDITLSPTTIPIWCAEFI